MSGEGDDAVDAETFFGVTDSGSAEKILHWMS
jgi:hypothetical protein